MSDSRHRIVLAAFFNNVSTTGSLDPDSAQAYKGTAKGSARQANVIHNDQQSTPVHSKTVKQGGSQSRVFKDRAAKRARTSGTCVLEASAELPSQISASCVAASLIFHVSRHSEAIS